MPAWTLFFFPGILATAALLAFYHSSVRNAWITAAAAFLAVYGGTFFFVSHPGAWWGSLGMAAADLAGILLFLRGIAAVREARLGHWLRQLQAHESKRQEEEKRRDDLKKELEKAEREVVRTLRLYGAMRGLGTGLAWDEMVPHIDYAVKQCLGLQDYQLYLLDENNLFQKVITRGFHHFHEAPLRSPSQQPKLHQTANETYLETPIRHGDLEIGFLWARVPNSNHVSKEELLVESLDLSEGLGMGLQKARLFTAMERLSQIDGLTGLHRRQFFNERLNEELRRARAFHTVFSILIADLDHFKRINDTYGHQAGDEVLKRTGRLLKESIYETDFIARYGGEEFIILFPQAEPAGVLRKAEALRAKISHESFMLGWNKIQITVSMGVAHYPKDGMDSATLFNAADQALYAAKNWGRNRVVDSSQI